MGGRGIQHQHHHSLQVGEGLTQDLGLGTQGLRGPWYRDHRQETKEGLAQASPVPSQAQPLLSWHVEAYVMTGGGCCQSEEPRAISAMTYLSVVSRPVFTLFSDTTQCITIYVKPTVSFSKFRSWIFISKKCWFSWKILLKYLFVFSHFRLYPLQFSILYIVLGMSSSTSYRMNQNHQKP